MKNRDEYNPYQNEELEQQPIQTYKVTPSTTFEETLKYYKKLNISKEDIGPPQDFRHLQHVDCQSFDRDESAITHMLKQQNNQIQEKPSNLTVMQFIRKLKTSKGKLTEEPFTNRQFPTDSSTTKLKSKTSQKQGRITIEDIGSPQDFKHVCHVGWNSSDADDAYLFEQIATISDNTREGGDVLASNNIEYSTTMMRTHSRLEQDKRRDANASISCPQHFRHVQHVSWDKDTGMVFRTESTDFTSTFDFVHEFITEYDKKCVSNNLQRSTGSEPADAAATTANTDSLPFLPIL